MNTMADRLIEAMTKSAARQYGKERVTVLAHADAKRYLCAADPGYYDTLSPGSKHTLALQGGIMTADEAVSVATQPWWPDALRLRRWDDEAKIVGKSTRPLSAWGPLLRKY